MKPNIWFRTPPPAVEPSGLGCPSLDDLLMWKEYQNVSEAPEVAALTDEQFIADLHRMGFLHPPARRRGGKHKRKIERGAMRFIADLTRNANA